MEEETNRDVPILYEGNRKQSEQSEPPVSAKQIDFIEQLLSAKRISIEQARAELQKRYRTIDYKQLTRKQASEFIRLLQERKSMSA